jgi:hypothetical protein
MATIEKRQEKRHHLPVTNPVKKINKPISGSFRTKSEAEAFVPEVEGNMHKYSPLLVGDLASHIIGLLYRKST